MSTAAGPAARMAPGRVPAALALLWAALACSAAVRAAPTQVAERFAAAAYDEAARALARRDGSFAPGQEMLWRSRLADGPQQAVILLQNILSDREAPPAAALRAALEVAEIETARGRPDAALQALRPWLRRDHPEQAGAIHLSAALALRAQGDLQQAREHLARVKSDEPAYAAARYQLGDIALQQGDAESAIGYLRELARARAPQTEGFAEGALWRALTAAGRTREADALLQELQADRPDCLALLEIRRNLQDRNESLAAAAPVPAAQTPPAPAEAAARFCLQFGAFGDRGLALAFQERYQQRIPGLRVDAVPDERGRTVYKVRACGYPSPEAARLEAARLRQALSLDVFVTELDGDPAGRP